MEQTKRLTSPATELFFISLTSLFFELLVIRWLTCDFLVFAVFKTFPLVTCFVGLGVGVAKSDDKLFRHTPLALLLFVALVCWLSSAGLSDLTFPSASMYQWTNHGAEYGTMLGMHIARMALAMILLLAGPFGVMACLGARIGVLFNSLKPLNAYCIDIAGAITGSLLFGMLTFLCLSPAVQIIVVAAVVFVFIRSHDPKVWRSLVPLLAAVGVAFIPIIKNPGTIWTPYGRIETSEINVPGAYAVNGKDETLGVYISVNHGFSQVYTKRNDVSLKPEGLKIDALKTLSDFLTVRKNYYSVPYTFLKPKEVLILGAGSGSDVQEAIRNGAEYVDAVELDPGIAALGKKYNATYADPKVHLHLDDARNFCNRCEKKYDMIIYACLDSRALSGTGSSMRMDTYIHTQNAYKRCFSLLKPDGLFLLSFGASVSGDSEWLRNRIYKTIEGVCGYGPLVITDEHAPVKWPAYIFVAGEPVRRKELTAPNNPNSFNGVPMPAQVEAKVMTDDWPYLYIRPVGVDIPYLLVVMEIVAIALWAGRHLLFSRKSGSDYQLFFLGSAFILLELQSISRLSLLYGTTWLTSTVVINGVLLMILCANFIILKRGAFAKQGVLYAGLAASLLLSYFLPTEQVLQLNSAGPFVGHGLVTLLTLVPMFMAGLIFASAFAGVISPARSFAFNLLGTVLGALLEYFSTYWGINSLVLISLLLYGVSYTAYALGGKVSPSASPPQAGGEPDGTQVNA